MHMIYKLKSPSECGERQPMINLYNKLYLQRDHRNDKTIGINRIEYIHNNAVY